MGKPVLSIRNISKSFPGVKALQDVSAELYPGEVLGLVGENGAGKSTLIKIVTGATQPDTGEILIDGAKVAHADPFELISLGVSAIYQEFSLFPELTVAENLFYGQELRIGPFLKRKEMVSRSRQLLERVGTSISPEKMVKELSVGHQQMVELAKAISRQAKVLIMDEPSAPLTTHEVEFLYQAVRKLSAEGVAIIYVSHRLEEIFELCSRVMILRDGQHVETGPVSAFDRGRLIELMVGRTLEQEFPPATAKPGAVRLEVRHLNAPDVRNVSFSVRSGEIVGLGGLVGAGRTETVRLIMGADRLTSGEILVDGVPQSVRSPQHAISLGIGLIPEDRKHQGALLGETIRFNTTYASLGKFSRAGFMNTQKERDAVDAAMKVLRVRAPDMEHIVGNLSGGNQQKVVLAKWLETDADILIFDEPTRGIDVGAKQEIYRLMRELSEAGKAIIMISSEMPELMGMSDRIVVISDGRSVAELSREEFDQARILHLASGGGEKAQEEAAAAC